jgi:hypothetical protein
VDSNLKNSNSTFGFYNLMWKQKNQTRAIKKSSAVGTVNIVAADFNPL